MLYLTPHSSILFFCIAISSFARSVPIHLKYRNIEVSQQSAPLRPILWTDVSLNSLDLYIVQFKGPVDPAQLEVVRRLGGLPQRYLPHQSYLVLATPKVAEKLIEQPEIAWLSTFGSEDRQHHSLRHPLFWASQAHAPRRFDIVPVHRDQASALIEDLETLGVQVLSGRKHGVLIVAEMNRRQWQRASQLPRLLWIQASTDIEEDVHVARDQGWVDEFRLAQSFEDEFLGDGIRGHILEGIDPRHMDFAANSYRDDPVAISNGSYSPHGQASFGIVFGDGSGNPLAQGFLPRGQGFYTSYEALIKVPAHSRELDSRYEITERAINDHQVMFQSASWGHLRTLEYDARSAEMDAIVFDLDLAITQSQSNSGNRHSRPQAWAKNVISVGAIHHRGTADPSDDYWQKASIGPAQDGRIKPDVVSYGDTVVTTARYGYQNFTGTSAATPLVAGFVGLITEMWMNQFFAAQSTDQSQSPSVTRPHASTIKALLIHAAQSYPFNGHDHNLNRMHQGWGFPSLRALQMNRENLLIINQDHTIRNLETHRYQAKLAKNHQVQSLVATLVYPDPPANVAASVDCINHLALRLSSADGRSYWGNQGLLEGNESTHTTSPSGCDTVQKIIISDPALGEWSVEVVAMAINEDADPSTEAWDAPYALVVSGLDWDLPSSLKPELVLKVEN